MRVDQWITNKICDRAWKLRYKFALRPNETDRLWQNIKHLVNSCKFNKNAIYCTGKPCSQMLISELEKTWIKIVIHDWQ